jgi:hypothetical protein
MVVDADILTNPTLAETFRTNWDMQDTDLTFRSVEEDKAIAAAGGGSSDMGNISHIMPGKTRTSASAAAPSRPRRATSSQLIFFVMQLFAVYNRHSPCVPD